MGTVSLSEAGRRLSMTPLQIVVQCALHGIPCESGLIEDDLLPVIGPVITSERQMFEAELSSSPIHSTEGEQESERRRRVVRRVLEKLSAMNKYWPARTEKRNVGRGVAADEVGLALRAADVLVESGILQVELHGGHEPSVGLAGSRRAEITDIAEGRAIVDSRLRDWIDNG